ncbi:hypothetical protein VCHA31O73_360010 [Vibrio chagasii]|nr:hypothetical protein VCHA31O73_360010 [Vibrio chagasii]
MLMNDELKQKIDLAKLTLMSVIKSFQDAKDMGLNNAAVDRIINEATICKDALTAYEGHGIAAINDLQLRHLTHQSRAFIRDLIEPFESGAKEVTDHYNEEAMTGFYAFRDVVRVIVDEWQADS